MIEDTKEDIDHNCGKLYQASPGTLKITNENHSDNNIAIKIQTLDLDMDSKHTRNPVMLSEEQNGGNINDSLPNEIYVVKNPSKVKRR